jgi:hypothetical protein
MAWDFFIFFSRSAAAGGRAGTVVANSDMDLLQWDDIELAPAPPGKQHPDSNHGYTIQMKGM